MSVAFVAVAESLMERATVMEMSSTSAAYVVVQALLMVNATATETCWMPWVFVGADCAADSDGDAICDDADNCTDTSACNYNDAGNEACAYLDE